MSVTKHTQTINVVIGLNPVAHTLVVTLHPNLLVCESCKGDWPNRPTSLVSGYLSLILPSIAFAYSVLLPKVVVTTLQFV